MLVGLLVGSDFFFFGGGSASDIFDAAGRLLLIVTNLSIVDIDYRKKGKTMGFTYYALKHYYLANDRAGWVKTSLVSYLLSRVTTRQSPVSEITETSANFIPYSFYFKIITVQCLHVNYLINMPVYIAEKTKFILLLC